MAVALASLVALRSASAGVSYLDPAGGWNYIYQGDAAPGVNGLPDGYGPNTDGGALDGTWRHDQLGRWDGHAPGDPISNPADPPQPDPTSPASGPTGPSPGGVGFLNDAGANYIRIQDVGDPALHGWTQNTHSGGHPLRELEDTNQRVYFGHDMLQDFISTPLPSQRVLDDGITLSFRARIPGAGPLDPLLYVADQQGAPVTIPWFDATTPHGRGLLMENNRGTISIMQNDPDFFNRDSLIGFSLVTSGDIAVYQQAGGTGSITTGSGSGGLIMNNLDGGAPSASIDSTSPGTLNILPMTDQQLNAWHEFWITIRDNAGAAGTHEVKVYMDGSLTPATFNVTAASSGEAAYADLAAPFLEFGASSRSGIGSIDVDFLAYKTGVIAPTAAPTANADFDADGDVDGADFLRWQRGFGLASGATLGQGDADGNGAVNAADSAVWKSKFGLPPAVAATAAVPEPGALCLALLVLTASRALAPRQPLVERQARRR
ncbi:MAG: hypothetical protein DCC67_00975 [Planctomycetota bacterium]|nr:MAG: hypothetical protein DCC67_00975 [Planctomycetota bacterium]